MQELTPINVVFEDAVFFFSDIDLQGKREQVRKKHLSADLGEQVTRKLRKRQFATEGSKNDF